MINISNSALTDMVEYNKRVKVQGRNHVSPEILVEQHGEMENNIDGIGKPEFQF